MTLYSTQQPSDRETTYIIRPMASSPTTPSTPSQSTSSSTDTVDSTPRPITPSRRRYPTTLGTGPPPDQRVPLHRRGTSKTFERLEDLLREAGYKETRVFTPESEHTGSKETDLETPSKKSSSLIGNGVGGVMAGFLGGFMSNTKSKDPHDRTLSDDDVTPPFPLAQRDSQRLREHVSQWALTLSSSEESPRPLTPTTPDVLTRPPLPHRNSSNSSTLVAPQPPVVRRVSQHQLPHQSSNVSLRSNARPHAPSRAGAYLRKVTLKAATATPSARSSRPPSIHRRATNDTTTTDEDYTTDYDCETDNGEPPMPATWLETVARAVLFGGVGAYVGGPNANANANKPTSGPPPTQRHASLFQTPVSQQQRSHKLRQTRSNISQIPNSPFVHTKRTRSSPLHASHQLARAKSVTSLRPSAPPRMMSRLTAKSSTVEGSVSHARVVCRSAPVSRDRSRSVSRSTSHAKLRSTDLDADSGIGITSESTRKPKPKKLKLRTVSRKKGKVSPRDDPTLPSLARTQVEGDSIWINRQQALASFGSGADPYGSADEHEPYTESECDESDDGEELDLAKMLIPPKRQNSIRSLRKHLHGGAGRSSVCSPAPTSGAATPSGTDDGFGNEIGSHEEWGRGWSRQRKAGSGAAGIIEEDEEGNEYAAFRAFGEQSGPRSGGSGGR